LIEANALTTKPGRYITALTSTPSVTDSASAVCRSRHGFAISSHFASNNLTIQLLSQSTTWAPAGMGMEALAPLVSLEMFEVFFCTLAVTAKTYVLNATQWRH